MAGWRLAGPHSGCGDVGTLDLDKSIAENGADSMTQVEIENELAAKRVLAVITLSKDGLLSLCKNQPGSRYHVQKFDSQSHQVSRDVRPTRARGSSSTWCALRQLASSARPSIASAFAGCVGAARLTPWARWAASSAGAGPAPAASARVSQQPNAHWIGRVTGAAEACDAGSERLIAVVAAAVA